MKVELNMTVNLWAFLSVSAILGVLFAMFVVYLGHKKTMKKLEIEALKNKNMNSQTEVERS